ncbi:lytic transglycosylase [Umboniibacter marinipuniceus]|uniref:Membrane-bound lytic murein transglycosylase D n=1 Tax=Umboniibacter marinipuniceus TaxID=569599 RepID=A0A3M0ABV2_9GAMM|nr:LysM peptidoglycan-binding domain-containing protein [Umboniibacter marinipuniceus]RMA81049.1 membrane-bound lytic murein transglycosylase D [Umboniibacter marinipuniceus]
MTNKLPLKPLALIVMGTLGGCSQFTQLSHSPSPSPVETADSALGADAPERESAAQEDDIVIAEAELDLPPEDVWEVIRAGLTLDTHVDRRAVEQQIAFYSQHQSYLNRVATRATPFMYHIVRELEERDLPTELALLPIVESAFDPFAYSHGRASGLWQFIPSTGTYFGLAQNWWYDGRRDPIAATDAALTYLAQLNRRFDGDWELAVASYNGGGGRVNSAVRRNRQAGKATDFWSLDLPRETEGYVPKLLALAEIVSNPEKYGVSLQSIPNEPYFVSVDPGYQLDISKAAELAGLEESEFRAMNAGYTKWATSPRAHQRVNVPVAVAEQFIQSVSSLPENERIKFERYQIREGDALSLIASRFNTQVDAIRAYNDLRGSSIRAGDYLLIPIPAAPLDYYRSSDWQRLARAQQRGGQGGAYRIDYRVESGDSLWELAREHGVNVSDIARWNNMAPNDPIRLGQELVIWQRTPVQANTRRVSYAVRQGDSLARIAQKFKVSVSDLRRWNSTINGQKYIQPGQSLVIFVDTNNQS